MNHFGMPFGMSATRLQKQLKVPDALEIAIDLVKRMGEDNNCRFNINTLHLGNLASGVRQMQEAGCDFDPEERELLAAGDEDERKAYFERCNGFELVAQVLAHVFNGPLL